MTQFFCDVETTGLDPYTCSIFQISGIIVHNGVEEEFDFRIKPYRGEIITPEASEKTGITNEELSTYPSNDEVFPQFLVLLDKYELGKAYANKAFFVGYNSDFDMKFLRSWFEFNGDTKFGYRFWWPDLDVCRLAAFHLAGKRLEMRGFKLVDVYKYIFGETFDNAHNSLADIKATRRLFNYFLQEMMIPLRGTNVTS